MNHTAGPGLGSKPTSLNRHTPRPAHRAPSRGSPSLSRPWLDPPGRVMGPAPQKSWDGGNGPSGPVLSRLRVQLGCAVMRPRPPRRRPLRLRRSSWAQGHILTKRRLHTAMEKETTKAKFTDAQCLGASGKRSGAASRGRTGPGAAGLAATLSRGCVRTSWPRRTAPAMGREAWQSGFGRSEACRGLEGLAPMPTRGGQLSNRPTATRPAEAGQPLGHHRVPLNAMTMRQT